MLTIKTFNGCFKRLQLNFEFQPDLDYQQMIYNALKDKIDNKMFIETFKSIMFETTKEEWNKIYGYKGRPAIADWINAFVPKPIKKERYITDKATGARLLEHYYDYPDFHKKFLQKNNIKLTEK